MAGCGLELPHEKVDARRSENKKGLIWDAFRHGNGCLVFTRVFDFIFDFISDLIFNFVLGSYQRNARGQSHNR